MWWWDGGGVVVTVAFLGWRYLGGLVDGWMSAVVTMVAVAVVVVVVVSVPELVVMIVDRWWSL